MRDSVALLQSFVQVQSADGTNPTATFTNNTAAGNTIIATPGCDTNLYTCPSTTLPTDLSNPGVLFSLVTTCTATNNGTASRTNIYVAYNIPGGTRDSISYQGGNVQMVIMELSGATAVDQAVCTTGHLNTGGTATSGPITTTHPAEVVLGAGTANCSPSCTSTDFTAIGTPNWTLGTIGTQVAEYQSLPSISSSLSATATVSGGSGGTPNESYAMAEVSFWNAPRVQGTACETGVRWWCGYTTCSLSGVTAGDTLLWFARCQPTTGPLNLPITVEAPIHPGRKHGGGSPSFKVIDRIIRQLHSDVSSFWRLCRFRSAGRNNLRLYDRQA